MDDIEVFGKWDIIPFEFPEGDAYLSDLMNIELASTGIIDSLESNRFFEESCQLIANAVKMFRMGIFDAAFYSLRQSIETSIGTLFLMANPKKIKEWNALESGFELGSMAKFLREKEPTFSDMREKMAPFFDNIHQVQLRTNKYVHKQGYNSFYTCHRLFFPLFNVEDIRKSILCDFEDTLRVSIGAVAVYRLAIDPLPVLLMEEDMMRRSMGFITEPFSEPFTDKYIGQKNIEAYKTTQLYSDYKVFLSRNEEKNDATLALAEWQFIDRKSASEIREQIHLLSFHDKLAFEIVMSSNKIANVYIEAFFVYTSDVTSPNNGYTMGGAYYEKFFSERDYNVPYKKAYISRVSINDKWTVVEHIAPFDEAEYALVRRIANHFDKSYKRSVTELKNWADAQGFEFREN